MKRSSTGPLPSPVLPSVLGIGLALVLTTLSAATLFWTPLENALPPSAAVTPVPVPAPAPTPAPTEPVPTEPTLPPSSLSLEQRQTIYRQLARAEDATIGKASAQFPDGGTGYQGYVDRETLAYQQALATEYGVSLEQIDTIAIEGLTQGWPLQ